VNPFLAATSRVILWAACAATISAIGGREARSAQAVRSVLTFHYDAQRTGWNHFETLLTPANVAGGQFGLVHQVLLDEQVDAQPLLAAAVKIGGKTEQVLYIVTENDTIYAIGAATGEILFSRNLGPAVSMSALPGHCNNNSALVGINSTPVIDLAASTLYVMAYTYVNNKSPTWNLYALDLATLADKVPPAVVAASAPLTDGSTYRFNAAVSRQRPALLEANGNIYAGFGSFCDIESQVQRGFVLGWQAGSLTPLPANRIDDRQAHSANGFFLSDVWMSGNGIAANGAGRLFFTTGNSDPSGTSYDPVTNLSESVVKLAPDLSRVEGFFTPSDSQFGVKTLDQTDNDFGSGGVTLLPPQPGTATLLAVAAGKVGQMYLLNRNALGGYAGNGVNRVLGAYPISQCWCGESYFTGADGIGRVVSSGGGPLMVWRVQTAPQPSLVRESQSQPVPQGAQDGGFFTTISSNGTANPIIWAVGRPQSAANDTVTLYAYDPVAAAGGATDWLYVATAGTWPNLGGNANIVPVVANGRVYVASYKELDIFGLGAAKTRMAALIHPAPPPRPPLAPGEHEIYGTIRTLGDGRMTLRTRTGTRVAVAVRAAIDAHLSVDLHQGRTVRVIGRRDGAGLLQASSIVKAKPSPLAWPTDR
jgi:hypothetical protein